MEEINNNTENTVNVTRLNWIDYARGIGILLIIVVHSLSGDLYLNHLIHTFLLPLFFLLSGSLLKESVFKKPFTEVLKKYFISLLLPYYFFSFITLCVELAKDFLQHELTGAGVLDLLKHWLLFAGIKADWFLPSLFFAMIITILAKKLLKNNFLVCGILLVITVLFMIFPANTLILFVLVRAVTGSFFVSVGLLLSKPIKQMRGKSLSIAVVIIGFAAIATIAYFNGGVNFYTRTFGNYSWLYYIGALCGTFMIFEFSKLFNNLRLPFLTFCGKNSLFIMAIHMEVMALCKFALERLLKDKYNDSGIFVVIIILLTAAITIAIIPLAKRIYNFCFSKIIKSK